MTARATGAALGLAAWLAVSVCGASPEQGRALARALGLATDVPCRACHDPADSGPEPAPRAFLVSLEERGFDPSVPGSLEPALERMRADSVDSDGDGARDLDELSWGGDPSTPDVTAFSSKPPPEYGCAAARARARRRGDPGWGAVATLVLLGCGSRRRAFSRAARVARPG